jgi:exodeoxyribonuclease V alpha subunit
MSEATMQHAYTTEQLDAIKLCSDLNHRIVCITGQAGTGKTTILRDAVNLILEDNPDLRIQLAAPTGRAAKRIEEATGIPAMTIHRMMKFSMPQDDEDFGLPAHDKNNPLFHDVIFIDEASMLTETLRRQVIDAMKRGSAIRFFGDINQLPPIDKKTASGATKSPFATDLKRFPSIILTQNFRSTDGIITAADAVIKNRIPPTSNQVNIVRTLRGEGLLALYKLCDMVDFTKDCNQIISPTRVGKNGCDIINAYIQQRYNQEKTKMTIFVPNYDGSVQPRNFKRGDKVIWDKNDYNLDLFNGTIGYIIDFDQESGHMYLHMDGRDIDVPPQMEYIDNYTKEKKRYDPRTQLLLAYAVTTHKAQGSQFDTVAFVIAQSRVATRQNVYTAITRAKTQLYIINVGGALNNAIATKENLED